MSKLLIVLVIFGVAGCSNKAIYDKLHLDARNKCVKEPPPTYSEYIERAINPMKNMSVSAKKYESEVSKLDSRI